MLIAAAVMILADGRRLQRLKRSWGKHYHSTTIMTSREVRVGWVFASPPETGPCGFCLQAEHGQALYIAGGTILPRWGEAALRMAPWMPILEWSGHDSEHASLGFKIPAPEDEVRECFRKVGLWHIHSIIYKMGIPRGSVVKNLPANAGDSSSIPGSGRSPGEGNGNHSSILAWKIPWTEEPGRLQSMGLQKSWTQLSD